MIHKINKKFVLVGVIILLLILSIALVVPTRNSDIIQIGSFASGDGHIFGNLFVRYTKDQFISDLYIKDENSNMLLKMDSSGIYSLEEEKTIRVSGNFYGYKIASATSDKIIVSIFTNEGKGIGDSTTIYWDYKTNKFKILESPF